MRLMRNPIILAIVVMACFITLIVVTTERSKIETKPGLMKCPVEPLLMV